MRHRYCSDNAVLTSDGVSRVFAGEEVDAKELTVNNNVIVNGKAFVPVAGDNLLNFPNKVIFVDLDNCLLETESITI